MPGCASDQRQMRKQRPKSKIEQTFRIEPKHISLIVDFGPCRTTILCQASVRFLLLEVARPAFVQSLHLVATISAVAIDAAIVAVVVFWRVPVGLQLAGRPDADGADLSTREVAKQEAEGAA